jgi:hypothetical protein
MLEQFYRARIEALENSNADYRHKEMTLTTYLYELLETDTPEEYKNVIRYEVFGEGEIEDEKLG